MATKAQRHYRYGPGAVSGKMASPRLCLLWAIAVVAVLSYLFNFSASELSPE